MCERASTAVIERAWAGAECSARAIATCIDDVTREEKQEDALQCTRIGDGGLL